MLATGGMDGCVRLWDVRKAGSHACLTVLDPSWAPTHPHRTATAYRPHYAALATAPARATLASAAAVSTSSFAVTSRKRLHVAIAHPRLVLTITVAPNRGTLWLLTTGR